MSAVEVATSLDEKLVATHHIVMYCTPEIAASQYGGGPMLTKQVWESCNSMERMRRAGPGHTGEELQGACGKAAGGKVPGRQLVGRNLVS